MNITRYDTPESNARASISRALAQSVLDEREPPPQVSLRNIIANSAGTEQLGTAELALRRRMEHLRGSPMLGESVIPWGLLSRAMGAVSGPRGGFAVGAEILPMQDVMRGDSVVLAAGAQSAENLQGQLGIARLAQRPVMSWVGENETGSASDPVLGVVSGTPRTLLGRVQVSLQLLRLSAAEGTLRDTLRRGIGEALDVAAVGGTGGAQPLGILNTPGVAAASGTSLSYAGIWTQVEALLSAGARMNEIFAVCGPTAGRILAGRERAAGSGFVLDGGRIGGIPCAVSANVAASTLVIGSAAQLLISTWGAGIELRTSQSTGFNSAQIDIRASLDCDVSVLNPSAFVSFLTVT